MVESVNSLPIRVAALSHRGRRENNEDSFYGSTYKGGRIRALLAVADGMGGHKAGEVASAIAINTLLASMKRRLQETAGKVDLSDLGQQIVNEVNAAVAKASTEGESERKGMGTTLTFAVLTDRGYFIGNIGDSRAYLIRRDGIKQISIDHTAYFEMIRSGRVSPEEASRHPHAHHITRSIGGKAPPKVDVFPDNGGLMEFEPGDVLVLCSDGLINTVRDEEILDQVRTTQNLSVACHNLVSLAYLKGGTDNISVVCAEVGEYPRILSSVEHLPSIDSLTRQIADQSRAADVRIRRLRFEIYFLATMLILFVGFLAYTLFVL